MENTKNTKQLKKQLMAAIAMFLVAAIALGSSTYAWFVQNYQVSATDMKVKAQAESGIVISNESNGTYATTAAAKNTDTRQLGPTCTKNLTLWEHNISDQFTDAKANQEGGYTDISTSAPYRLDKFYIKSSGPELNIASNNGGSLVISDISLSRAEGQEAQALSQSLRLAVKVGESVTVYAPCRNQLMPGTNHTYAALAGDAQNQVISGLNTIPANGTTDPVEVSIYIWFDGEDPACTSSNIVASLESLNLTVNFKATEAATQN